MSFDIAKKLVELAENGVTLYIADSVLKVSDREGKLSESDRAELKENKEAILKFLDKCGIDSNNQLGYLSFQQQRLWLIDKIEPGNHQYNMPGMLKLAGALDERALKESIKTIVNRHSVLRTVYHDEEGNPYQLVRTATADIVKTVDISGLGENDQEEKIRDFARREAETPFDLSKDLMLRASLLKQGEKNFILFVTMHHIAADAWSIDIILRELAALYTASARNLDNPLPEPEIQYIDYAYWQRQWLQGDVLKQQLDYWSSRLQGVPQVHSLPLDQSRPPVQSYRGGHYWHPVDQTLRKDLDEFVQKQGVTLFMALQAAFTCLLSRYSGKTDILMGTPVANRLQPELEQLVGFFANTLVLRTDLSGNPVFSELLRQSKEELLNAYEYQQLPFEKLVDELHPERSLSHSPLFQILFALQSNKQPAFKLPGLDVSINRGETAAKFDLTLEVVEDDYGFLFHWEYSTDLFREETITRMAKHFVVLLRGAIDRPETKVNALPLLTLAERQRVLQEWNNTRVAYPEEQCMHELFQSQVGRAAGSTAVLFKDQKLSYGELNARSNRLAHYLIEQGVKPETLVGLNVERSLDMLVGLLGILKAGGAYVPLDPGYPSARLEYMLNDSGVKVVFSQTHLRKKMSFGSRHVVCLDDEDFLTELNAYSGENPEKNITGLTADNLAYVIYTSGSTGQPKGVMIEHGSLTNFLCSMRDAPGMSATDSLLAVTSTSFDIHTLELYLPLISGARVVIAAADDTVSPANINALLKRHEISIMQATPSTWKMLLTEVCRPPADTFSLLSNTGGAEDWQAHWPLKILCGGEAWSASLKNELLRQRNVELWNMYGPTETTVWSSVKKIEPQDGDVHLGPAIANTQLYVLDENRELCPVGVPGELYIGGKGLARGYLNRPELTEERFVINPFSDQPGARMYRTGDLVRWLERGNLQFMGRIDHQVKIHGFRIELGEIENRLSQLPGVHSAVVVAREDEPGNKRLVAYITANKEIVCATAGPESDIANTLRTGLQSTLPGYMVPSVFVLLDALPLTPNGKIDRQALPVPEGLLPAGEYVAPRSDAERTLAGIWAQLLAIDIERLSVTANFFALGGDSILSIQMVSRAAKAGVRLTVKQLFEHQTIRALALHAYDDSAPSREAATGERPLPPVQAFALSAATPEELNAWREIYAIADIYPATPMQRGMLFHSALDTGAYVTQLLLDIEGVVDAACLQQAWQQMVDRHDIFRTVFVDGESGLQQLVLPEARLPWCNADLSEYTAGEQDKIIHDDLLADKAQGFELSRAPLMRMTLWSLGAGRYRLLWSHHHVLADGWSLAIIFGEVVACYRALIAGKAAELADPVPYRHYVGWLQARDEKAALAFWRQRLAGLDEPTPLPERRDESWQGTREISLMLDAEETAQLTRLCRAAHTTMSIVLQAAWAYLLSRYSGERSVVFGATVSGRQAELAGVERMVGLFINTVPVRVDVPRDMPLMAWLRSLHQAQAEQDEYNYVSLAAIQRSAGLPGGSLFDSLLVFENYPIDKALGNETHASGLRVTRAQNDTHTNYGLSLIASQTDRLTIMLDYQRSKFDDTTVERLLVHFHQILKGMAGDQEAPAELRVGDLPMMSRAERHYLLHELNDTRIDYPRKKCIHELFERQALENPEAVALVFEDQRLTYAQLNSRANQLAHYLREVRGLQPDTLVGICLERSLDLIVGILGILKAGGAYVPLDPEYPDARLAYMLEDAGLETVLTTTDLLCSTPVNAPQAVCLDAAEVRAQLKGYSVENPHPSAQGLNSSHLAYVIYTSGSTGRPKGVMIEHKSVVRLVINSNYVPLTRETVMLQAASISFDAATFEIWGALLNGGQLVLCPERTMDLSALAQAIEMNQVNTAWMTSGLFGGFVEALHSPPATLKYLLVGGDVVSPNSVKKLYQRCTGLQLINGYGPTENTTFSCCYPIPRESYTRASIPIGKSISNSTAYVLDEGRNLQATGVIGELYVGGVGLARGYLNRPDLTAERFVPNPFSDKGDRLYRTGDLARYLPDGNIEFLGRKDHQVKIRGFRVELGEIENVLLAQAAVKDAAVIARESAKGKQLLAYVVLSAAQEANDLQSGQIDALRQALKKDLPDYMIPAFFIPLDKLPVTANGKLDRTALSKLEAPRPALLDAQAKPATPPEILWADLWASILGIDAGVIGIHANFFELGGDSLLAMQLVSKANQAGLGVTLKQILSTGTLAELALINNSRTIAAGNALIVGDMPLTVDQAVFLGYDYHMPHWGNLLNHYEQTDTVDLAILEEAVNAMLVHHDAMRARFTREEGVWRQTIDEPRRHKIVSTVDLSHLDSETAEQQVNDIAYKLAQSFDLSTGPLVKIVQIDVGAGRPKRLLFAINHLIMDGFSLRILMEDIATAYQQLLQKQPVQLPKKTTSVKDWIARLEEYANSNELKQEAQYWQSFPWDDIPKLPVEFAGGEYKRYEGSHIEIPSSLSEKDTLRIMNDLPRHYGVSTFEAITAALVATLSAWMQSDHVPLYVLDSGRNVLPDMQGIDLSRTVGWLSYPRLALLQKLQIEDVLSLLKSVSMQLKTLPNQGSGFGILSAYNKDNAVRDKLRAIPVPQVWLNYTGVHTPEKEGYRPFPEIPLDKNIWTPLGGGEPRNIHMTWIHPDNQEAWYILLRSGIRNNRFHMHWRYSENLYRRETIEALANNYLMVLRAMAALPDVIAEAEENELCG